LKLANLTNRLDVTWLEGLDPELFRSINTPDDYDRFNQAVKPNH
jgi:molybdopterin-guanine dinucleotide biosynthesis protein A